MYCSTSLEFLADLGDTVEELALRWLDVEDISQLAAFHKLRDLVLEKTNIQHLEPLAALRGLRSLSLENSAGVKDLSALRGLKGLRYNVEGTMAGEGLPKGWLTME